MVGAQQQGAGGGHEWGSSLVASVPIRYDGRLADGHKIDMADLAEALAGWNRILVVCGNFAATQRFVKHLDAAEVRAVIREGEGGCYTFTGLVEWIDSSPLVANVVGGLTVTLIGSVLAFACGKYLEMRHLRAIAEQAVKQAGTRDDVMLRRLMDTIDRLIEALQPAARQTVRPIGRSASTMTVPYDATGSLVLDEADAAVMRAETPVEVGPERHFMVRISELDVETGNCRIAADEFGEGRIPGQIADPVLAQPNNAYALALAAQRPLLVRAKPTLRNGEVERLFITDATPQP